MRRSATRQYEHATISAAEGGLVMMEPALGNGVREGLLPIPRRPAQLLRVDFRPAKTVVARDRRAEVVNLQADRAQGRDDALLQGIAPAGGDINVRRFGLRTISIKPALEGRSIVNNIERLKIHSEDSLFVFAFLGRELAIIVSLFTQPIFAHAGVSLRFDERQAVLLATPLRLRPGHDFINPIDVLARHHRRKKCAADRLLPASHLVDHLGETGHPIADVGLTGVDARRAADPVKTQLVERIDFLAGGQDVIETLLLGPTEEGPIEHAVEVAIEFLLRTAGAISGLVGTDAGVASIANPLGGQMLI